MKSKQLSKSWKALLSIVLSIALVLGLMPSLQNARNFAGADEGTTDETEQIVADENTQGGEATEQAEEQASEQSEESSEEQSGKGGETTDPEQESTDAEQKATTDDDATQIDSNTAGSEIPIVGSAATTTIKVVLKGLTNTIDAITTYLDQSEAEVLSGNVYFNEDTPNCPPIIVGEGGLTLVIKDDTTVTIDCRDMINYAGIRSDDERWSLTITSGTDDPNAEVKGTGKLIVYGAEHCAAIGGYDRAEKACNINIESCIVEAYGGEGAAAIGGGYMGIAENITINGGTTKAWAGDHAAAIGSGSDDAANQTKNITINGGSVYAYGGGGNNSGGGAGIGTGRANETEGIYINENIPGVKTYVEAHGGVKAAGIGNGDNDSAYQPAHDIYITGGTIKAYGGCDDDNKNGGAGIGGGNGLKAYNINISGGDVYAKAGGQAAGIGGGSDNEGYDITISGGTVTADAQGGEDGDDGAGIGGGRNSHGYRITICGGTVYATSHNGAGIGGGKSGKVKNDDKSYGIDITGGHVEAKSNGDGAAIGSGKDGDCEAHITISGTNTYVNAYACGCGAGIGSGKGKKVCKITINDGTVIAKSAGTGAGIGSGEEGKVEDDGSTGTININGGNVNATGGGNKDYAQKENGTGSAIGCGASDSHINDDTHNKRVDNVYISSKLSAKCYWNGGWAVAGPYDSNWATQGGYNVNWSIWRDVSISNGIEQGITVDSQTYFPEYGTSSISSYDVTANYVSSSNWSIKWYKDGQEISEGPASYSITGDSTTKKIYFDYDGNADAGDYEFTLSCDGVASNKATYKVNKRAATIISGSATKVYDGTPLTCNDSETTGFLDGQGVYVTYSGSQTEVGNSKNTFDYVAQDGTNLDNYAIEEGTGESVGCGTLTVLNQLFVVTAGNYSGMYDGQEHNFNDAEDGTQVKVIGKNGIDYTSVATFVYATKDTEEGEWSAWSADKPSVKNVDKLYVKVQATATIGGQTSSKSLESDPYTMEVAKRNVTLTSADDSKEYDGTPLTCEAMSVGGDGFAGTEGARYECTGSQTKAGSSENSFSYELNGGASADNYHITTIEGTLTVTPKSDPITIKTFSKTWKYDGQVHSACTSSDWGYYGDLVSGESLSVNFEHTDTQSTLVDAGTYANSLTYEGTPEQITKREYQVTDENGEDVTNCYTFNAVEEGTLTIEPREVTLTSGSDLKVWTKTGDYAENTNVAESGDGLLDGEKLAYSGFPKVTEISFTPTDNTFTYEAASGSAFKANNYEITQVYGKLMLVDELAIIAGDQAFTYDGSEHQAGVTTVPSEGAEVSVKYATSEDGEEYTEFSSTVPTVKDAGTLYIWARATKGVQTKDAKYTATVNKRGVIIASESSTKNYDGDALTEDGYTISGDGFADGEGLESVTCTGSQLDVGSSENSFSYELESATTKAENYIISKQPGTLTVTPHAATIAITTGSSTAAYNGTALTCSDWEGTFGEDPIKPSEGSSQVTLPDTEDILIVTCTGSITDVGSTQNTCTYRVERKDKGDDVTANYSFAETTCGTLTVTHRSVVINTASANKVYDGDALTAGTYTISGDGFIADQGFAKVNIVGTITNVGNVPNLLDSATPYTLKEGTDPANYKITTQPGTLTVDKRKVTVTSGSAIKTESAASTEPATNPSVTISGEGFVTGEMIDGYPKGIGSQSTLGESKNNIEYKWGGAGNPANYEITEKLGVLKVIADGTCEAIATGYSGVYDGEPHSGSVAALEGATVEYSINGGETYSTTNPEFTDYGANDVLVRVKKDTLQAYCTFAVEITKRPITLTAGSASRVYNGEPLTCADYTIGGDGFANDTEKADANVYTDGSITNVEDSGPKNLIKYNSTKTGSFNPANYNIDTNEGNLTVTKRTLILRSNPIGDTKKPATQLVGLSTPDVALLGNQEDVDALMQTQDAYNQIAGLSNAVDIYNELQATDTDPVKYDGNKHNDNTVIEIGKEKNPESMGFAKDEKSKVTFQGFQDFIDAATYMNTFTIDWGTEIKESNYETKIIYAPVTIDKRNISFTSATDSKMYDGDPLTNSNVSVGDDGFAKDEGATFVVTGTQTKLGESANTFKYEMKSGTKDSNYNATCTEGVLTVINSDKLNIVASTKTTFDYTGEPQGEPATATIDGEEYTGTIWYSTDGGKTYKSSCPMLVNAGSLNVKAHVVEYGYVTSECDYTLTINAKPATEDDFITDVNQEDLNNAAEDFLNNLIEYEKEQGKTDVVKYLVGSGACAWIEGEFKATEDPEDMAKLLAAAPGKSFKYADVRLYVSLWDDEGNPIEIESESGETIEFDKFDIGDYNEIPIRITYKSDMTNTKDVECMRVHNGEVASLPQGAEAAVEGEYWQMGEGQQSVMIAASKYSTYAAAYNVQGGDDSNANATGTGATGDNTNLAICLLGLLMSCCAAYALVYMRRRKDN